MPSNSILSSKYREKFGNEISFIRNCAKLGNIKISDHCHEQISKRKIRLKDVFESIENGAVIEVQNLERDIKILFQDSVNIPPTFFVVVAVKPPIEGICVTAYLPDKNIWVLDSNNQWRRK